MPQPRPPQPARAVVSMLRLAWQLGIPEPVALAFVDDMAAHAMRDLPFDAPAGTLAWLSQVQAQARTRAAGGRTMRMRDADPER